VVTFRAYIIGTNTATSATLIDHMRVWLQADGNIPIDVVLVLLDQSCPLTISSRNDPECVMVTIAEPPQPKDSSAPLVLVIGVSAGVGGVLVLAVGVAVAVIIVMAMSKSRRSLAIEGKR
jgi:hypothetical protein